MLEESRLRESTFRTMNKVHKKLFIKLIYFSNVQMYNISFSYFFHQTLQEEVRKLQKIADRSIPNSPQPPSPGYSRNPLTPTTPSFNNNNSMDDDTRVLYIRDVVLKFLEFKDRRVSSFFLKN